MPYETLPSWFARTISRASVVTALAARQPIVQPTRPVARSASPATAGDAISRGIIRLAALESLSLMDFLADLAGLARHPFPTLARIDRNRRLSIGLLALL